MVFCVASSLARSLSLSLSLKGLGSSLTQPSTQAGIRKEDGGAMWPLLTHITSARTSLQRISTFHHLVSLLVGVVPVAPPPTPPKP